MGLSVGDIRRIASRPGLKAEKWFRRFEGLKKLDERDYWVYLDRALQSIIDSSAARMRFSQANKYSQELILLIVAAKIYQSECLD